MPLDALALGIRYAAPRPTAMPERFVGRGRVHRAQPGMSEGRTVRLLTDIC
ncbi:MAG: hypothetical protein GKR94_20010 [Gammaproteobacteria bacterium]|nr:hypothetical protein [Gammaproteobacteria bacterium]